MNRTTKRETERMITVDIETLSGMLCCGHQTARKIAEDAQAVIRINRRVLYSVDKIVDYVDSMAM